MWLWCEMFGGGLDSDLEGSTRNWKILRRGGRWVHEPRVERHQVEIAIGGTLHLDTAPVGHDLPLGLAIGAKGHVPLESELRADDRTDEEENDPIVGDDEAGMLLLPGPAGEGDGEEIDAEDPEPRDEPRGLVDPGPCHGSIEMGLREGCYGNRNGDGCQQNQRQLQGSEKMNQSPDWGSSLPLRNHARP